MGTAMIGCNCCAQTMQSCFNEHTRIWGGGARGRARTYKGDRGSGLLQGTVSALLVFGECRLLPMSDVILIRNLGMETSLQYLCCHKGFWISNTTLFSVQLGQS